MRKGNTIKAACLNKPEVGEKSFCCNVYTVHKDKDKDDELKAEN